MDYCIKDMTRGRPEWIEQAAVLLHDAFHGRTESWQDLASARQEVFESLVSERISRVAVDGQENVVGWIGGIPSYHGRVWELDPLVVAADQRRRGIGRALVEDLERILTEHGAQTLWLGSDDENGETSLSALDLYADIPEAIRAFRKIGGEHPCEFYFRLGFRITGVLPDANGPGQPDIFFAKRVRKPG